MPDMTIILTERLELALRAAALRELDWGADDIRSAMRHSLCSSDPEEIAKSEAEAIHEGRMRVAGAGQLLDWLGYFASDWDECGRSLTAPAAALRRVAANALDILHDEISEPECFGRELSPLGLRASADLWEQLQDTIHLANRTITACPLSAVTAP